MPGFEQHIWLIVSTSPPNEGDWVVEDLEIRESRVDVIGNLILQRRK